LPTSRAGAGWPLAVSVLSEREAWGMHLLLTDPDCEDWAGISLDEFPHLNAWIDKIVARPGSEKGRHVPKPHTALENRHKTEAELDKAASATRAWVQEGMKGDAKK